MKRHQKGLSLTEMAIVLGAMGLIMAAIWAIVGTVWDGYRQRKMTQQIQTVAQAIQDHYGTIGGLFQPGTRTAYGNGTDLSVLVDQNGLVPVDMRLDRTVVGVLNHAAGGVFTVEARGAVGNEFRLTMRGLKIEACTRLLLEFPVAVPEVGVRGIGADGGNLTVDPNDIDATSANFPLSPTTAVAWCNDAANSNEVFIDFTVRK